MKTYHIKDLLKKELLIVEAKDEKIAWAIIFQKYGVKAVSDYTLLGKPDEIKEEDVKDLIEKRNGIGYIFGNTTHGKAIDSFNSALESEIYWDVNPIEKPKETNLNDSFFGMQTYFNQEVRFDEAESRTFGKSRTLIFVKN